jgi:hypothetical protein
MWKIHFLLTIGRSIAISTRQNSDAIDRLRSKAYSDGTSPVALAALLGKRYRERHQVGPG